MVKFMSKLIDNVAQTRPYTNVMLCLAAHIKCFLVPIDILYGLSDWGVEGNILRGAQGLGKLAFTMLLFTFLLSEINYFE